MKPQVSQIWQWLDQVPDPEIPVISVVDLGIVRGITWDNDTLVVALTPTYTGCPATRVIADDVEKALRQHGVDDLRIESQLSPAWTSDWLSDKGRARLEQFGIAPPQVAGKAAGKTVGKTVGKPAQCPRCKGENLTKISQFGSTPCKAQWRCNECLEPFDYFKCI
jgi:ring-1,2-phenylacetyl-CoA epoxidase subunit PaaD